MKKTIIGILLSPILAYIIYVLSLMAVFNLNFDLNLFNISLKVLKALGSKQEFHNLKLMAFIPLFLGFFTLVITLFFSLLPQKIKGDYGNAKFANIKDIVKLGLNYEKGLILAKWKNKFIRYSQPLACLIVAPPGTGKTASIAIPNLLKVNNSFIVTDIKGELIKYTANCRQKILKNKILIFSPLGEDNTMKFNPFDEKCVKNLNFTQKKRLVEEVANTLFIPEKGKDANDFWLSSVKNLLIELLASLVSSPTDKKAVLNAEASFAESPNALAPLAVAFVISSIFLAL